ncbi:MAG: cytochrome c oxidase accessory protein CcoG [Bacteriovorax sp.]|jgi:cytochrome c oxidase accessory protein FixG
MTTKKNRYELDPERLATTDEAGHRVYLYPEDTEGKWKDRRKIFYWFLIVVYLVLPWFYIKGKPFLMIDIAHREFTFMGSTLHGVEPILMFIVVISGLFFIAFMTSIFGRVWCGWACPQTVFIQSIFMKIETLVEGRARARRELAEAPWSFNKFARRSIKWILFTIISLHITHTFLGYFVGPRELVQMSMHSPGENPGVFMAMLICTGIILFDFGWFREQFCIIACPYGRMQSVLMDENSLVVAYDTNRGEPRRTVALSRAEEGDCINDYACVRVCPTGIDIRRGIQMECIACTQCIDACDDIMRKINKPEGLIRYSSEVELAGGKHKFVTIRSMIYLFISMAFIVSFFFFLSRSTNLSYVFIRGSIPFTVSKDATGKEIVLNNFQVKIVHQGEKAHHLEFKVHENELKNKVEIITPMKPINIDQAEVKIMMFFKFDPSILINGTKTITMEAVEDDKVISTTPVVLVGPSK